MVSQIQLQFQNQNTLGPRIIFGLDPGQGQIPGLIEDQHCKLLVGLDDIETAQLVAYVGQLPAARLKHQDALLIARHIAAAGNVTLLCRPVAASPSAVKLSRELSGSWNRLASGADSMTVTVCPDNMPAPALSAAMAAWPEPITLAVIS